MEVRFKHIFSVILAVAAVFSCTSEPVNPDEGISGSYSVEALIGEETKTSLDGYKVLWSANDKIEIFSEDDYRPSCFVLETGAGTSKGTFSGSAFIPSGIAKYPFYAEDSYSDGTIKTNLPSTQTYVPESFAQGTLPMAAVFDIGNHPEFHSLCAVVKVSILGTYTITSIILKANSESVKVSGPAVISFNEGTSVLSMDASSNLSSSSVELTCNRSLSDDKFTDFYIIVPPQFYKDGITVTVNSPSGSISKSTSSDPELKAGRIYSLPPFEMILNGGYSPSASLFGEGTLSSPFLISSVEDLLCFQDAMNRNKKITSATSGKAISPVYAFYQLTKDINLSVCCGPELGSWTPIGPDSNRFCGHFDGGGHKITGLYINNESTEGGLFGDIYTGGYLGNLDVTGDVNCYQASILCKTNYALVEKCVSRGKVHSSYSAGGLINGVCGTLLDCTNYADVTLHGDIYNSVGGIASHFGSDENSRMINCANYGTITGVGGNVKAGGICAYFQQYEVNTSVGITSEVLNCTNFGDVIGEYLAGGITADMFDCRISNCVNYGNVRVNRSDGCAGGICGQFRNPFSQKGPAIHNCLSTGNVSGNGALGGICASNVMQITDCYWLYDSGIGVPVGVKGGTVKNVVSLNRSQMKGTAPSPTLYGNCTDPVKALNAWAFANVSSFYPYCGWEYDMASGYPSLTGMDPLPADGETEFLSVRPGAMTLSTISQTISISASSSSDITVRNSPSWVSLESNTKDIRNYTLTFDVGQNTSGAQREGTIELENADGLTASVQLTQRYTYYSEDFSRDGNVVTLQTHTSGNGIDLVFFGDAYTDKDISSGLYLSDMKRGVNAFFSAEPYASFRNLFDVKYVELVSASNSFDEDSQTALSTYFGEGTLVGGDNDKVSSYCKQVTGKSDLKDVTAIVIINARKYAGTCYMYYNYSGDCGLGFSVSYFGLGTSASGQTSMEAVLRHEAGGHGFGKLSDEYSYYNNGTIPASEISSMRNMQQFGWYPNVDFTSNPFSVSWSKFITDDRYSAEEIGVFEGAATYWYGAYRPTVNSIMRYNTGKFNAPSREAIYKKMHKLAFGSSWAYNYDEFLEYDAINRTSVSQTHGKESLDDKNVQPLHPPVVIYREP